MVQASREFQMLGPMEAEVISKWRERFDADFIKTLRAYTQDPTLDIVWDPGAFRMGRPVPKYDAGLAHIYNRGPWGAWRVVRWTRVVATADMFATQWPEVHGRQFIYTRPAMLPVNYYCLDGNLGMPWTPGDWLIKAMVIGSRNPAAGWRAFDEAMAEDVRRGYRKSEQAGKYARRNSELHKALVVMGEHLPRADAREIRDMEAAADRAAEQRHNRIEQEAEDAKTFIGMKLPGEV